MKYYLKILQSQNSKKTYSFLKHIENTDEIVPYLSTELFKWFLDFASKMHEKNKAFDDAISSYDKLLTLPHSKGEKFYYTHQMKRLESLKP